MAVDSSISSPRNGLKRVSFDDSSSAKPAIEQMDDDLQEIDCESNRADEEAAKRDGSQAKRAAIDICPDGEYGPAFHLLVNNRYYDFL